MVISSRHDTPDCADCGLGGLGMNTGIQDAFHLGWKLAMVTAGVRAPDAPVLTYLADLGR